MMTDRELKKWREQTDWNPRFVRFAKAHHMTPFQAIVACKTCRYQSMIPFTQWISKMLFRHLRECPENRICGTFRSHEVFDNWIDRQIEEGLAADFDLFGGSFQEK